MGRTTDTDRTDQPPTSHHDTAASGSLIRSLSAGTMEGPYSARFPSSPIGETSRRAPAGRRAADERSGCGAAGRGRAAARCRVPALTARTPAARTPTVTRPASRTRPPNPTLEAARMAGDPTFQHRPVMVQRDHRALRPRAGRGGRRRHRGRWRSRPGAARGPPAARGHRPRPGRGGAGRVGGAGRRLPRARHARAGPLRPVGRRRGPAPRRSWRRGGALRPRRQLAPARSGRARLQLPPRRTARHAHGSSTRPAPPRMS